MYNPYQAPGQYGRPADYSAFPGAPPGMAPPPGMAAPGTAVPPGIQQLDVQSGRPGAFPANFQPPANMPNINFSAPVIRLGTSGPSKPDPLSGRDDRDRGGRRPGLGAGAGPESGRRDDRERIVQIQPSTKEEIIKTIFIGGITEGAGGDEGIERILRTAGSLRRWVRATDADDKPCKFGFAEYEDPESLSTAIEVLRNVEVPVKRQTPGVVKDEEDEEIRKSRLLILIDDNSLNYVQQWEDSRGGPDPAAAQMRLDHARSALEAVLSDLANPSIPVQKDELSSIDRDGDIHMADGVRVDGSSADIVTIPITVDDELSDIPAEMRETVAREITAFRDRSNRRDLERLKREEEIEQQERTRMLNGSRSNRLASPPPSAPSGPAGGANGVPVGPRSLNAPSGPKGFGQQIPRDYQKGVAFINGTGISGVSAFEDEDTDASDEELEQRRRDKRDAELEKNYLDQERRWLNRERSKTAAVEREKARDQEEDGQLDSQREAMRKRLKEWNDDLEREKGIEEYYVDRSAWMRNRAGFRQREILGDDADRAAEARERARDGQQRDRSTTVAEDFPSRQTDEMATQEPAREPARFKLSLGAAAAQKAKDKDLAAFQQKKTVADVEGLLEDEEEVDESSKRTLIPIKFDPATTAASMTEEERQGAAKQLAQEIPTDKGGLWAWNVAWEFVGEDVIEEKLRPFVERKVVEALGLLEQMVVDVVVGGLRNREKPQRLVEELEGALDEEAEVLVRKLWRMVIFFSESEKRGIAA